MARIALPWITDAIDGPPWWWWLPSMCLPDLTLISSIFYQSYTCTYHKQLVSMITACDRPLLWWWLAIMCLFLPIHITGWNFLPFNVCYDLCQGHISGVNLVVGFFAVLTKILKYIYVPGKTGKYLRAAPDLPVSCCIYDSMWSPVVMIGVARCLRQ